MPRARNSSSRTANGSWPSPTSSSRATARRSASSGDVQPDVVDLGLRDAGRDLLDERLALVLRQPGEVRAEDHGPQERLERLAGLELRRRLVEPDPGVDEAGRREPPPRLVGPGEER